MHNKLSAIPKLPVATHSLFLLVFIASLWCVAMGDSHKKQKQEPLYLNFQYFQWNERYAHCHKTMNWKQAHILLNSGLFWFCIVFKLRWDWKDLPCYFIPDALYMSIMRMLLESICYRTCWNFCKFFSIIYSCKLFHVYSKKWTLQNNNQLPIYKHVQKFQVQLEQNDRLGLL